MVLDVQVGEGGRYIKDGYPTTVEFWSPMSGTTVTAYGGKSSPYPYNNGGDGYSGGGGSGYEPNEGGCSTCGSWGGMNGGHGYSGDRGTGGYGSGQNIRSYALSHFTLSPGYYGAPNYGTGTGGGGGGVLVDGNGPSASQWHGRGYGGGAGNDPGTHDPDTGLDGVVLLEVV